MKVRAFIYFRGPNPMRLVVVWSVLTLTLHPTLTLILNTNPHPNQTFNPNPHPNQI